MSANQTNPLLHYCLKMSMSYSYKPVLIMSLLENDGMITMNQAANYFAAFYGSRLAHGLIAEKSNSIYSNLNCSLDIVRQNIISNPVKALTNSSPLFRYNARKCILEIERTTWRSLTTDDINKVYDVCHERLDRYYINLSKRNLCLFQEPEGENGFLSNDFECPFVFSGNTFINMTQYMSYRKAQTLGLDNKSRQLLKLTNLNSITEVYNDLDALHSFLWNGQQQLVAYQGLISKFTQNDEIATELLNTGSSLIVACLPTDPIWGIGLDVHNADVTNIENWRGSNLLGYSLMQARNMVFSMRSL